MGLRLAERWAVRTLVIAVAHSMTSYASFACPLLSLSIEHRALGLRVEGWVLAGRSQLLVF